MIFPKERLSNLCLKITDGSHNPPKGIDFSEYLMFSSKNIDNDKITYKSPRYLTKEDFELENRRTQVTPSDVLLTIVGTIGRCAVVPAEIPNICLQRSVAVLKPNHNKILSRFLMYSLMSMLEYLNLRARGVAQKGIYLETIRDLEILLPPLATQQKIVNKLDAIFAEIDKATAAAEANAKNAEALFQSYLAQVFEITDDEWNESELGKITEFIDYRGKTPTKTSDGIRLITAKNVKFGFLNREPYEYIAEKDYEGWMTRGIPKKGDVLFTTEAPLANVAQIDTDEKIVFAQRLIILQPQEKTIDSEFLKFSLLSRKVQNKIISKGTGATVKGIKASLLKLIPIEYPSLNRQREICKVLADIKTESNKLKDYYTRKISSLILYKNSILRQAFAGELVKE